MRTTVLALILAMGCLPLAATAQTDAEDIAATIQAFAQAAQAGDAGAVGELIADPFAARIDPMDELHGRDSFLSMVAEEPAPPFSLGEFEPWVGDGAAYLVAPIELDDEGGVIESIDLAAVLLHTEERWKLAAAAFILTLDEESPQAAEPLAMRPEMEEKLTEYSQQLQAAAVNRDMLEFFKLCHEDAVLGERDYATGEFRLTTGGEMVDMIEGLGEDLPGYIPADNPDPSVELGFGTAMTAYNMNIVEAHGTAHPVRTVAIMSYSPDQQGGGQWWIIAAFQIPLPE
ncbi:MAG: hypothetical protein GF320_23055 [Armatimonadia bacterium]|nr:hypothetical protein [Armatimonadia bacterium]